ncbi:MAG TPA: hypothetical protein PKE06_23955, partial [Flavilitoribacter sp.]|nr:hypothetical protein [Flavilitoribacter sp.]HMQ91056.1 hypothetical protein [Flavilitoribacter sp.]
MGIRSDFELKRQYPAFRLKAMPDLFHCGIPVMNAVAGFSLLHCFIVSLLGVRRSYRTANC